jgi:inosose dehydratase
MRGVAGAPVSFGVFELAADGRLADPDEVLASLHEAGYDGVDLGPVGWLGRGSALRERLRRHELSLAGGWVDLPFPDDQAFQKALPALDDALGVFTVAAELDPARPPLPTLADSGSEARRAHPGGAPGTGLDDAGWARLAGNVAIAARRVRDAGLEPTFHHHVATYVETPDEIERFLGCTDVGLTLDTGHLLLGGGDPSDALRRWRDRINHVHVKDVRKAVLAQVVRERAGSRAVWERGAFVPLGRGDLDLPGFLDELLHPGGGFAGWVVVEQDVIVTQHAQPAADQRANRQALRRWLP